MRSIMTNALALRMNFAGRGSKIGIADLKIMKIIICKFSVLFHHPT